MSFMAINSVISDMFYHVKRKKMDSIYPGGPYWGIWVNFVTYQWDFHLCEKNIFKQIGQIIILICSIILN